MMKYLLLCLCLLVLVGCVPAQTEMPDSLVMLTGTLATADKRCTGFLPDSTHILTANHCANNYLVRVITQYGQEAGVKVLQRWPDIDIALLAPDTPLYADQYATLGKANLQSAALAYGACPQFFTHVPRPLVYVNEEHFSDGSECQIWFAPQAVCGGDSGGIVTQGDQVIGIMTGVETYYFFWAYGQNACIVPAPVIEAHMAQVARH